ncbi:hypothetical protein Taro_017774 [Colocasia esculenta]|uniref:Uncharacterized protein n=1 Tax=Colocasia esculenta TaxID=4460 RepID=A0A843US05_COLES|nr:hypothetical protein [Colocasia esculenta]
MDPCSERRCSDALVPTQPRQQQGSVQTTLRTATSYASTSTRTTANTMAPRRRPREGVAEQETR